MIKRFLKSATVKNAGWIIFGRLAQMLISLIVGLITARYLGPANYGILNYGLAYVAFFTSFCTLGINSVLVKEFVDHPGEEGAVIGSSLLMRGISSILSALAIVCLVYVVDAGEKTTIVVVALCSMGLVFNIFEVFNYWFQSRLQSKVTAVASLAAYAVTAAYKIVLLVMGKSVEWFAFSSALDYICIGVLLLVAYRKYEGKKLSASKEVCRRILSKSIYFILPGMMVAIYGYADKFMLKQMLGEINVGYYSTATTVCGMWSFVLAAVIDSMTPSIMASHNDDRALYEKQNRQLYAIVFYIAITVSCMICIFGKPIVYILYGQAYLPAAAPLRVVTWYTAFSYLGVARNAWIVCENKQKYLKYIYISAAVSNVILNFALIPQLGATGAALASLITQVLTTLVVPFFIKDIRGNSLLILEGICLRRIR